MAENMDKALRSNVRRKIARLCAHDPRSVGDLAAALGRPDGAIRPTVNKMVEAGVLRTTTLPERRAQGYVVAPAWQPAVRELARELRTAGTLTPTARLIHVRGPLDTLAVALSDVSEHRAFAWAARPAAERFAVLLDGSKAEIDEAHAALLRHDLTEELAEDMRELMTPMQLRAWAAGVDRSRSSSTNVPSSAARLSEGEPDE